MTMRALLAIIIMTVLGAAHADDTYEPERRLNKVTVKTLPPDKGELHINPIIRRPADFQRPGFSEMELVFVPVGLIENQLEPLLGEENRDYLRLVTKLPNRPDGVAFEDTPKDYFTQSVILPRGYYVLSEVTFRQKSVHGGPDLQTVSHCLSENSFLVFVKGGDVMFMGRPEFDYPSRPRLEDPSFSPAGEILDDLSKLRGWRWTTKDLVKFEVTPATFQRSTAFCSPSAISPGM